MQQAQVLDHDLGVRGDGYAHTATHTATRTATHTVTGQHIPGVGPRVRSDGGDGYP